jgi:uncharacterized membrane protein YjgN (DUF898 family)
MMEQEYRPKSRPHSLAYDGMLGALYRLWLFNLLLSIVTLGIYSFWGRTRVRRYAVASYGLDGDRFEYTGTGGELFRGFLKVLPVILLLYLPYVFYPPEAYPLTRLLGIVIFYLVFVGIYAAIRYRLSRTQWRGIRGRLTGSAFRYGALQFGLFVIKVVTLWIAAPWADRMTSRYLLGNVWFGSVKGDFNPKDDDLWGIHFLTWFLAIPTIGISRFWYAAALRRYQLNNLRIGPLRFKGDMTGGEVFALVAGNSFVTLITLGLGRPIAIQRDLRFVAAHVWVEGDLEAAVDNLRQSAETLSSSGESLDGVLGDAGLF